MKIQNLIFVVAFTSFGSGVAAIAAAPSGCLPSGTEKEIQDRLNLGGANYVLELCQKSSFKINQTVLLKFAGQKIRTQGRPLGNTRATLVLQGNVATAIRGRVNNLEISNLSIDGSRSRLGYVVKGGGLIEVGGANVTRVYVHNNRLREPRGWTALHIAEGSFDPQLQCRGASILNNEIGPAGSPDGTWADGISLACRQSSVMGNRIVDATDGGIVLFGAAGSNISSNQVIAQNQTLLGGINLVDYAGFNGVYDGVIVKNNSIEARNAVIKLGIAVGGFAWFDRQTYPSQGASIVQNVFRGPNFGAGLVLNGAKNVVVQENVFLNTFYSNVSGASGVLLHPVNNYGLNFKNQLSVARMEFGNSLVSRKFSPRGFAGDPDHNFQVDAAATLLKNLGRIPTPTEHKNQISLLMQGLLPKPQTNFPEFQVGLNSVLYRGQSWRSNNLLLTLQSSDGNLVLYYLPHAPSYHGMVALWATGSAGDLVAFQMDGNFVQYQNGRAVWNSGTTQGDRLVLQEDGNLVIYDRSLPIWSTHTSR